MPKLKFTGNPTGAVIVLAILVMIWFTMGAPRCQANELEPSGLSLSFGLVTFGSSLCGFPNLTLAQQLGRDWQVSMTVHGDGECRDRTVDANGGFCALRTTHAKRWSIGFGGCAWLRDDVAVARDPMRDEPQLTFGIQIRRFVRNEHLFASLLHGSTGGTYPVNRGRNFLNVGWEL